MDILFKLRIFFYLHSHGYEKISKLSDCDLYEPIKNKDRVKYQALSAFYMKNYYHARKCYEILADNKIANSDDYNKLAYIYSRHNEKENAIISWCKSSEKNKKNKVAESALNYIKNKGREINLIEDTFFEKISCKQPFFIPFKQISFYFIIILFISLLVFWGYKFGPGIVKKIFRSSKDISKVVIDDYNPNVISEPKFEERNYSFSEVEVRKYFDSVKDSIIKEDVNSAIININKLRLSNASFGVKLKLDILADFIEEPDYSQFVNTLSYRDIRENTDIFNGIYIKWHGRIVNSVYDKKEKKIGFNLILGDENEGLIDGIIPVIFTKAVIAENNSYASVFGKVNVIDGKVVINGSFLIRD